MSEVIDETTGDRRYRILATVIGCVVLVGVKLYFSSPTCSVAEDIVYKYQEDDRLIYNARTKDHHVNHSSISLDISTLKPVTAIRLLGERNSGTNYIEEVLSKAFDPQYSSHLETPGKGFSRGPQKFVGFKHMFRHRLLDSSEVIELINDFSHVLWIMVVRSPCDWADGMFRKPYNLCSSKIECKGQKFIGVNKKVVKNMTREEFFNFPWNDYIEAKNGEKEFTYSNVFELRRHKLDIMKQIMDAVPHRVVVVHLNVVERAPEFLIRDLVKQFNLDLAPNYVVQNQSKHAHSTLCLNNSEWKVAQENIDWDIEALFGYQRLDCHICSDD